MYLIDRYLHDWQQNTSHLMITFVIFLGLSVPISSISSRVYTFGVFSQSVFCNLLFLSLTSLIFCLQKSNWFIIDDRHIQLAIPRVKKTSGIKWEDEFRVGVQLHEMRMNHHLQSDQG